MDQELVKRKLASTRSQAQRMIEAGEVKVPGVLVPKSSTLIDPDTEIRAAGTARRFVSRGGLKLDHAIGAFGVEVAGRHCVDVGASTGGFTDCLLQRGADHVVALDVGYGQLAWRLRSDPRVRVIERTNVRHIDPLAIGAPFDLVVVDVSFISLVTIAPALFALGHPATDYVLLIKPQFELSADLVGKGGVVKDIDSHRLAVRSTVLGLDSAGIGVLDVVPSPITGQKAGNREFLAHGRAGKPVVDLEDRVQALSI